MRRKRNGRTNHQSQEPQSSPVAAPLAPTDASRVGQRPLAPAEPIPDTSQEPPAPTPADQIIQHAIREQRAGLPVSEDARLLAEMEDSLPHLEALLASHERELEAREQEELTRASTPLALCLEVMGCRFASTIFGADKTMPDYRFDQPCIYGKTRPDQECRKCVHHQIIKFGAHLPAHQSRYIGHGALFPIVDEAQASQVADALTVLGLKPLGAPHQVHHAMKQALEKARERRDAARRREIELRQGRRL